MSKEGCLSRIKLYRDKGNKILLEKEEKFFEDNYSEEDPVKEESKKSKKSK